MISNAIALVNWEMGATIIGVFGLVCLVLIIVVTKAIFNNKK
ncbi:hypothetical protein [Salegentibacter chungangensis]|uniref:Oxaloacetate decarboxylase n=1 Tax=Salegentibacter chungangensis TaxID=1335724 RepID=A0ABW3NRZ3_9FLAO